MMTKIKPSWTISILQAIRHQTLPSQVWSFWQPRVTSARTSTLLLEATLWSSWNLLQLAVSALTNGKHPPVTQPQNNFFYCRNSFLYVPMNATIATNLVNKMNKGFKAQIPPNITYTKPGRAGNKRDPPMKQNSYFISQGLTFYGNDHISNNFCEYGLASTPE